MDIKKVIYFNFFILFSVINGCLFSEGQFSRVEQLKSCLENCWGIDSKTTYFLCAYFMPFSEGDLIENFIAQSSSFNIQFPLRKELAILPPDDGVIQATKFHPVVFESPYVRVLAGCAAPGEREPFHSHAWKSLVVVFEKADYLIEEGDGTTTFISLLPGVYYLPPEGPYACTNMSSKQENCLRFEVKD